MSAATIEATKPVSTRSLRASGGHPDLDAVESRPRQLRKPRRPRPSRGSGRRGGPTGRSTMGVAAPSLGRRGVDAHAVAGCHSEPAVRVTQTQAASVGAATGSRGWRLTDRGIAVVLITGAVLLAAAVTVITATAITVTSADYVQPGHSAIVGR